MSVKCTTPTVYIPIINAYMMQAGADPGFSEEGSESGVDLEGWG